MAANMATGKAQNSRKLPKAVKTASHSAPRKNRREELKGMLGHEHAACVRAQCNPIYRTTGIMSRVSAIPFISAIFSRSLAFGFR